MPAAPQTTSPSWNFPKGFATSLKPEWIHYIQCEMQGEKLISLYHDMAKANIPATVPGVANFGLNFSSYDSSMPPPWDFDLKDFAQNDVCWGTIPIHISEALFTKGFIRQQVANSRYLPQVRKNGEFEPEFLIPTMSMTTEQQNRFNESQQARGGPSAFAIECSQGIVNAAIGMFAPMVVESAASAIKKGIVEWCGAVRTGPAESKIKNFNVLLTDSPFNSKQNRMKMAEIMFETFNVKGLFIGVQATLALYA